MQTRQLNLVDHLIGQFDAGIRTLSGTHPCGRPNPAIDIPEAELSAQETLLAGRLMRVNHAGEVAAQGLYQGQALTASLPGVRDQMEQAADEENDHLAWCQSRAEQLGVRTSLLDPFWYLGSLTIGALAGVAGDKWSLGFVAETEQQVVRHLDGHLQRLPPHDAKSRAILEQMKQDELQHATTALAAGGVELPRIIKNAMRLASKVMTKTAFWI